MRPRQLGTEDQRGERRHREAGDKRTPYARDRDRILYSTAFQRLAETSQVVAPGELLLFHNRLTHTLEVAQIARRTAEALRVKYQDDERMAQVQPDVVEAASLAHDLGHPPFGHIGEEEIDRFLRENGYEDGFEGNAQSFRILTTLSTRSQAFHGLNLTRAVLNASMKYPWRRGRDGKKHAKFGAYATEEEDFNWVRKHTPGEEQTIESKLMDWADDVAYSVHDLCDFYKVGLVPLDRLANNIDEFKTFFELIRPTFEKRHGLSFDNEYVENTLWKGLLDYFPFAVSYEATYRHRAGVREFSRSLIKRFVEESVDIVAHEETGGLDLAVLPDARHQVDVLKQITWEHVIVGPGLATSQHGQRRVLRFLLEAYANDIAGPRRLLTKGQQEIVRDLGTKHSLRALADIVSGLTERQAFMLYRRLTGSDIGSILDRLP